MSDRLGVVVLAAGKGTRMRSSTPKVLHTLGGRSLLGPVGMFLGAWLVGGAITDILGRIGRKREFGRLLRLPRADWGKTISHCPS